MYTLMMSLGALSLLAMFYFGLGILVPKLPGVRTRGRAFRFALLSLVGMTGFSVVATSFRSPEQKAESAQRVAEDQAERDRRTAAQNDEADAKMRATARAELEEAKSRTVELPVLLAAYDDNELAADSRFKGKTIQVSGIVDDVKNDILGTPFVILGTGKEFEIPALQCSLAKVAKERAAMLHKGQRVTLRGEVSGLMMHVQVRNCEVM